MFLEFKRNVGKLYDNIWEYGWSTAWINFIELLDPQGEMHALKVNGYSIIFFSYIQPKTED